MSDDRAAIEAGVEALAGAFTAGDVDGVMAVFDAEPMTFPPDEPLRQGRDSVRAWHQEVLGQFKAEADLEPLEIEVSGDLACATGCYDMKMSAEDGGELGDSGKFLMVWKRKKDGSWKLARNIWNSDLPGHQ